MELDRELSLTNWPYTIAVVGLDLAERNSTGVQTEGSAADLGSTEGSRSSNEQDREHANSGVDPRFLEGQGGFVLRLLMVARLVRHVDSRLNRGKETIVYADFLSTDFSNCYTQPSVFKQLA